MALCISIKSYEPQEYSSSNKSSVLSGFLAFDSYLKHFQFGGHYMSLEVIRKLNIGFVAATRFFGGLLMFVWHA